MREAAEEAFLLTDRERQFLMMVRGIRSYYGFSAEEEPMGRREGTECLFRLMKEGLVSREGESFLTHPELAICLDRIGNAEEIVRAESPELPIRLIYVAGEGAAVCEPQSLRPRTCRMWNCRADAWAAGLLEDGYFPELPGEECSAVLCSNRTGEEMRRLIWTAYGLSAGCRLEEKGESREIACGREELPALLEKWRRGETI